MSISIVHELTTSTPIEHGSILQLRVLPTVSHLFQFTTDNPTVESFNEHSNGADFEYVRSEVRCVDQAQLDLYLSHPDNMKSTVERMNSDPEIIALCTKLGCTLTVAIVENTTTSRGNFTLANMAEILADVSA